MFNQLLSLSSTTKLGGNIAFSVIMILLTVAVIMTAVWLIVRFMGYEKGRNFAKIMAIVVAVGVVARIVFAIFIGGYRDDMKEYGAMLDYFSKNGVVGYYKTNGTSVYPLTFYAVAIFGGLGKAMGLALGSAIMSLMIKIPFIIADAVTTVMLYKLAKRYINSETAVVFAGLFSICPVFMIASSVWGTELCIVLPFIVGAIYSLVDKKPFLAMFVFTLATLVATPSVYLFPVFIVYYGYQFVRSIISNAKLEEKKSFKERLSSENLSLAFKLPAYFIACYLVKYLVSLPLMLGGSASPFKMTLALTLAPLAENKVFTYNGLSIFNIFGKNATTIESAFPQVIFVVGFGVLLSAIVALVYFSKKNRAVLPLLFAYISFTLTTYFAGSTAVSTLISIALLLVSFIFIKDRRILQVFSISAILFVVVTLTVMTSAG